MSWLVLVRASAACKARTLNTLHDVIAAVPTYVCMNDFSVLINSWSTLRSLLILAKAGTAELCAILVVADLNILEDRVLKRAAMVD